MSELVVNLEALTRNTSAVASLLRPHGLDLVGVTKACLGEPMVGRAMLDAGATALADTRDGNLARLRRVFPDVELHRIHIPPPGRSFVLGDTTYVSGADALATLSLRAEHGRAAGVVVVVETGDEREGVPAEAAVELARLVQTDYHLRFVGIATNYACFAGKPGGLSQSVDTLAQVAEELRGAGLPVQRVSAGNSAVLSLLLSDRKLPPAATELRCGEALLFGHETIGGRLIPGAAGPSCMVRAEVLERYTKASSSGVFPRAVLNVGRQDLGGAPVEFVSPGLEEVGRSSEYMIVREREESSPLVPGELVEFVPSYYALAAAWGSPYLEVRFE